MRNTLILSLIFILVYSLCLLWLKNNKMGDISVPGTSTEQESTPSAQPVPISSRPLPIPAPIPASTPLPSPSQSHNSPSPDQNTNIEPHPPEEGRGIIESIYREIPIVKNILDRL